MSAAEILEVLVRTNLALGAGVLLVLALRRPVRALGGARAAYALWLAAPLAALAVLVPPRTVTVMVSESAPAAVEAPAPAPAPRPGASAARAAVPVSRIDPAEALVAAWALVAVLALGVQAVRQHRFVRSLGRLRDEDGVFHAEHVQAGPAVIGALLPRLVLPADFASRFTDEEQALVLAHERNHLAVGDAQINAMVAVLQGLCWFNPLVHLAARRLRVDQEIACDAAVLARFPSAARAYGEAMLKTC
ncbi:M56 family metallopeptidase, partial [Caulobacter sp.]|uniref:M56 family metallopeptidase n=1 Tax=Caulobacter sp. TaxID=78 RepID=UPI001B0B6BE4